jgi:acetyl-CoA C-acetyltransferase
MSMGSKTDCDFFVIGIDKKYVDQVLMGNVLSAGVGQAPARQAALQAGLSTATVCTTINKVCASGMKAITLAIQSLQLGQSSWTIAGGMESMSRVPFLLNGSCRSGMPLAHQSFLDGILWDGLTDVGSGLLMGECGERSAAKHHITRQMQDDFAKDSYEKARRAIQRGLYREECVSVPLKKGGFVAEDEEPNKMLPDLAALSGMRTVFQAEGGTITAGNASKLNDGAAALLLTTMHQIEAYNQHMTNRQESEPIKPQTVIKPMARILGYADAECDPIEFSTAPSLAIPKALQHASLNIEDIHFFEINEAFSAVVLANCQLLGIPREKVNCRGGGVALGHPIGASGARIVVTLLHQLQRGQIGCAAICNGGGGATALIIQRL